MSSLKFGTSGLRGLVTDLVDGPGYSYSLAFLNYLKSNQAAPGLAFIGRDLRSSSPRLAADCIAAAEAAGFEPVSCGAVPTPALALAAMSAKSPAIMVTGSHIPDDRNGLKFYLADGEISKADEDGILAAYEPARSAAEPRDPRKFDALLAYRSRYVDFFGPDALSGMVVGVYQHSTVARDVMAELVEALGGTAVPLGRSDRFIPVDTEAHRPEDVSQISEWAAGGRFDAIISADGDADRPLVADETGRIVRGDVLGLLTARHLGLTTIVTPVTSSSAIETSGVATKVVRTRVGSPFVVAGMEQEARSGASGIVGFEANGGLLLYSPVERHGRTLPALPTRDAMLPILATLSAGRAEGKSIGKLVESLNAGHTAAHRLQETPASLSTPFLEELANDAGYREAFFAPIGDIADINVVDGVRIVLTSGATMHFRASGNAPELRCYVEAGSEAEAQELLRWGLAEAEKRLKA
jgi:phosphomannomutase